MTAPEIQQEIDRTREQLGQTVDELAGKADMKARARGKAAEIKARAKEKAAEVRAKAQARTTDVKGKTAGMSSRAQSSQLAQRRWPLTAVAATVVVAAGSFLIWRRRKT